MNCGLMCMFSPRSIRCSFDAENKDIKLLFLRQVNKLIAVYSVNNDVSGLHSFEHVMQRLLQLGEWYVEDKCIGSTASDILGSDGSLSLGDANLFEPCCAAEPIFSCHYKDKPSKLPCKDSITIDNTRKSFW